MAEEFENRLTFDGHDLSKIFATQTWERGVSLGRTAKYMSRTNEKGVGFLGTESEIVTIATDILFHNPGRHNLDILADILSVDEPKKLTNSNEPDVYYMAFPKPDIDSDETSVFGNAKIVWEIPDGVSHAVAPVFVSNEGEGSTILVTNPGTETMDLELTAEFPTDSGFLSITSDITNNQVLFGNVEEVDGHTYQKSELLFDDYPQKVFTTWDKNVGVTPPVTYQRLMVGEFEVVNDPKPISTDKVIMWPKSYGSGTAYDSWHGPAFSKSGFVDSNGKAPVNWTVNWRTDFNTTDPKMIGHQSITLSDKTGNIICAMVFEDNAPGTTKSDAVIYIGNERKYDSRKSDYYVTLRPNMGRGVMALEKYGSNLTAKIASNTGKTKVLKFVLPNPDVELHMITYYAAAYKSYKGFRNNVYRALRLTKHNVDKWSDDPNKITKGDVLVYKKEDKNVTALINNMNAIKLRDVGSTTITAAPGDNIFSIGYSDWAGTPKVTLKGWPRYAI